LVVLQIIQQIKEVGRSLIKYVIEERAMELVYIE